MEAPIQQTHFKGMRQQSGLSAIDDDLFALVPTKNLCLPIGNKHPVKTRIIETNVQPQLVVSDFE